MRVSIGLLGEAACLLVISASFVGCHSGSGSRVNEIIENRPNIIVSDLPTKFLDPVDTTSGRTIKDKLTTQDSLTLDGTTLIVGNVGDNRTVTLACRKLKLINGARIVTNGNELSLIALDMEFNNSGGIDSFFGETAKASTETKGSDGGRVEIYIVNSVDGSLRIFLPGQLGGNGKPGDVGANGNPGTRGSNASDHVIDCATSGGDGGKGSPGTQGGSGHPGKAGGNGGDLILRSVAAKDYDSHFPYQAPPGAGGAGGPGGTGGSGGPGGEGGSGSKYCGGGHGGAAGDPGLPGPTGDDGPSGTSSGKRYVK